MYSSAKPCGDKLGADSFDVAWQITLHERAVNPVVPSTVSIDESVQDVSDRSLAREVCRRRHSLAWENRLLDQGRRARAESSLNVTRFI